MAAIRKLRYGMVGGGPGSFIGETHRIAAAMDGMAELVAGAFSADPAKSATLGAELFLDSTRVYGSYLEMLENEATMPSDKRMDFVSIITPNYLHFPMAQAFIEAGYHIVCDKPMTMTVEEAEALVRLVREHDIVFALTHNYTGYPMVKQARAMVAEGRIGKVRKIVVEYPQGWLTSLAENEGHKQAVWRSKPEEGGVSLCVGDIGTHAENLARYITGLRMESLIADLTTFVEGRTLDDDANMLVRYEGGARGILYASQISTGDENSLAIRVYGEGGKLEWHQEDPNYLWYGPVDGPLQKWTRGSDYNGPIAAANTRVPRGLPEGFFEAFANIYRNVMSAMISRMNGETPDPDLDYPTVEDGAIGVHFIHKAVESSRKQAWVDASYQLPV